MVSARDAEDHADRWGPPPAADGPEHPRRVLANNVGYFTAHRHYMDYPTYRRKGWPIGSGVTNWGADRNQRCRCIDG